MNRSPWRIILAKKIKGYVKLQIPAGKATPAPPIGPALGQAGINISAFTKDFNARTQKQIGDILPTVITVYSDKSFSFITKSPPASALIKKALKLKSGANTPGTQTVGEITKAQLLEIAKVKAADLNANDDEAAVKIIAGSARSMGISVVD